MKTLSSWLAMSFFFFCLPLLLKVHAQSPVQQFFINYVSASSTVSSYSAFPTNPGSFSSCSSNSYTYSWSNGSDNQLKLNAFNANSKTYIVALSDSVLVKLRRVNNANVSGTRNIIYCESTNSPAAACITPRQLNFKTPYSDEMTIFLNNNVVNQGTDNIFTNASNGDGNNNNIERVDVIFKKGIASSIAADAGFLLCERGNNYAHDGFRIAAILSLDMNGDPASFGPVNTCVRGNGSNNGSWGHPSIADGNVSMAAYVLRKDAGDSYMRVSSNVNQEIGGVFFSLADLGVANNQVIYGYALIGPDGMANPTSAQLLDLNNASVYPTATTEAQGGGLDLIAVNTFFGTNQALSANIQAKLYGLRLGNDALLKWEISNITERAGVTLQRSSNDISYNDIYTYEVSSYNRGTYRDQLTAAGIFYYRLKITTASGVTRYSPVLYLKSQTHVKWKLFPSITKMGGVINIEGFEDGRFEVCFTSLNGSTVFTQVQVQGGRAVLDLVIPGLKPAMYVLRLRKNGQWIGEGQKIIILNQ